MKKTVLLLSGTGEGRILARALCDAGFRVRATVTRAETVANFFGRPGEPPGSPAALSSPATVETSEVQVEVRGFTEETLESFLRTGQADGVLDGTHPFAVRITRLSHAVCGRLGMPYVRYERPDWQPPTGTILVDSFAQAAEVLPTLGSRAMLTIGCKQLKRFVHLQDRLTIHARILPSSVSIEQAVASGFRREQLVCAQPPVSRNDNRASFLEHGTEILVTKASGQEGGVIEKVLAAQELGIRVVMIRRPMLSEIPAVSSVAEAINECVRKILSSNEASR